MRYPTFFLILILLKTGGLWAQPRDTTETSTRTAVVNAGWLRQYEGLPSQWIGTPQGGAEVAGYPTIDKKIRFFRNSTFEIDIYKDEFGPVLIAPPLNECCSCRERRSNEVTVLTGTWVARRDSVFLSYKWKNIYKQERYAGYQARKEVNLHPDTRPATMSGCAFRVTETYFWQDGKLCFAGALNECYK